VTRGGIGSRPFIFDLIKKKILNPAIADIIFNSLWSPHNRAAFFLSIGAATATAHISFVIAGRLAESRLFGSGNLSRGFIQY